MSPLWPARAGCRWSAYAVLWTLCVVSGAFSAFHAVLRVAALLLGLLLAISLPLIFMTLFELTFARRDRRYTPLVAFPWLGSVVISIGVLALVGGSEFLVAALDTTSVGSASELCTLYAGVPRDRLPRTVCVRGAFVKTDWEAAKLQCVQDVTGVGNVRCTPSFVAAPIFDDRATSQAGLADAVQAWAVNRGSHVDANYRPDGTICGFLAGLSDLELYLGDYHLAVSRAIQKQGLVRTQYVGGGSVPLSERPILFSADPVEALYVQLVLLTVAAIFLCLCPCAGPVPVGATLLFFCWARHGKGLRALPQDDEDFEGNLLELE